FGALSAPGIAKRFASGSIPLGGTSSLTFTITNSNPVAMLTGVQFSDNLPAGVTVAATSVAQCGGTLTSTTTTITLAGASIAAGGSCTFSITVTGVTAGTKTNSTSPVTSSNGGTGNSATATLVVGTVTAPTIAKAFGATSIPAGGTTSLSFTVTNPNGLALTGVAFNDPFPAGLVVATPNGLSGSCGGGSITATAGSGSVSLAGATLAAQTSCPFSVNVTGTTTGRLTNITGPVTSTNGGTGNTASASVTVSVPGDSDHLHSLEQIVTRIEALASGAAFAGAVDGAIADGFSDCRRLPIMPNGAGLRFNFKCDPTIPWRLWADVRGTGWNTDVRAGAIAGGQVNALAGVTYRLTPDFLIGAVGGYENFNYTSSSLNGRLKGDGWTVGGYLGWLIWSMVRFDAAVGHSSVA